MAAVPVEELRLGILFGVTSTPHLVSRIRVLLNGEDLTERVREGCVGEDWWVEAFRLNEEGEFLLSEEGEFFVERGKLATEILRGHVTLEWKAAAA